MAIFTIPNAVQWPKNLQRERSVRWTPDFGNESSPPALDGTRQFRNTNGGGLWRAAFIGDQLTNRSQVLTWMAKEVRLRGGMRPVDVPFCGYRPRRTNSANAIVFKAVGGWAARAVSGRVSIRKAQLGDLVDGMHFSDYDPVNGWRMYRIENATAFTSTSLLSDEEQYDIDFWPPARKLTVNGDSLEIEDGVKCVMRLATSDSMDLELELRKRGYPSAEFIEAF